jgi:hypothetical protein
VIVGGGSAKDLDRAMKLSVVSQSARLSARRNL